MQRGWLCLDEGEPPGRQIRCPETEELESRAAQVGDALVMPRPNSSVVLVCLPRFD